MNKKFEKIVPVTLAGLVLANSVNITAYADNEVDVPVDTDPVVDTQENKEADGSSAVVKDVIPGASETSDDGTTVTPVEINLVMQDTDIITFDGSGKITETKPEEVEKPDGSEEDEGSAAEDNETTTESKVTIDASLSNTTDIGGPDLDQDKDADAFEAEQELKNALDQIEIKNDYEELLGYDWDKLAVDGYETEVEKNENDGSYTIILTAPATTPDSAPLTAGELSKFLGDVTLTEVAVEGGAEGTKTYTYTDEQGAKVQIVVADKSTESTTNHYKITVTEKIEDQAGSANVGSQPVKDVNNVDHVDNSQLSVADILAKADVQKGEFDGTKAEIKTDGNGRITEIVVGTETYQFKYEDGVTSDQDVDISGMTNEALLALLPDGYKLGVDGKIYDSQDHELTFAEKQELLKNQEIKITMEYKNTHGAQSEEKVVGDDELKVVAGAENTALEKAAIDAAKKAAEAQGLENAEDVEWTAIKDAAGNWTVTGASEDGKSYTFTVTAEAGPSYNPDGNAGKWDTSGAVLGGELVEGSNKIHVIEGVATVVDGKVKLSGTATANDDYLPSFLVDYNSQTGEFKVKDGIEGEVTSEDWVEIDQASYDILKNNGYGNDIRFDQYMGKYYHKVDVVTKTTVETVDGVTTITIKETKAGNVNTEVYKFTLGADLTEDEKKSLLGDDYSSDVNIKANKLTLENTSHAVTEITSVVQQDGPGSGTLVKSQDGTKYYYAGTVLEKNEEGYYTDANNDYILYEEDMSVDDNNVDKNFKEAVLDALKNQGFGEVANKKGIDNILKDTVVSETTEKIEGTDDSVHEVHTVSFQKVTLRKNTTQRNNGQVAKQEDVISLVNMKLTSTKDSAQSHAKIAGEWTADKDVTAQVQNVKAEGKGEYKTYQVYQEKEETVNAVGTQYRGELTYSYKVVKPEIKLERKTVDKYRVIDVDIDKTVTSTSDDTQTPGGGDQTPGGGDQTPGGGDQTPGGGDQTPGGDDQTPGGDDQTPGGDDQTPGGDEDDDTPAVTIPDEDVPLVDVPDEDVPLVDVPDEDVPLVDVPDENVPLVDVPDENVPLVDLPDENVPLVDLPDGEVPLSDVPQTGDSFLMEAMASITAGVSALWLAINKKRKA